MKYKEKRYAILKLIKFMIHHMLPIRIDVVLNIQIFNI